MMFLSCFIITFAAGYLYFQMTAPKKTAAPKQEASTSTQPAAQDTGKTNTATAADGEGSIFVKRGCVQCHSIKALNVQGGAVGPDLSHAYTDVQAQRGIPIQQFLKKPNSAVMSGVLGSRPLSDADYNAVLAALKAASEKP